MDEAFFQVKGYLQAANRANALTAESLQRVQAQQELRSKEVSRLNADLQRFTSGAAKLEKRTKSLHSYCRSVCDAYEVLVTHIVRIGLKDKGEVYEMARAHHKIPKFPPEYDRGVEWDGVLYIPERNHLYLVEANGNLINADINGMPPRIERTLKFIEMCAAGRLPPADATYHQKQLCRAWADMATAEQVFGVVGAPGFTTEMFGTASMKGLLAVFFNDGVYHMKLPSSGALLCHKTLQCAHTFNGGSLTEEVLETMLEEEAADVGL